MPIVNAGGVRFDVDAIAFDKDGTLIDLDATWGPIAGAWVHGVSDGDPMVASALAAHLGLDLGGATLVTDSIFAAGTLQQIRDETALVLAALRLDAAAIERAIGAGTDAVMTLGPPIPTPLTDLGQLFGELDSGGVRCAVVTSDDRASTDALLAALGVGSLVTAVVGGDETARPKPFPDALALAAERLGVATGRLLMVGDSLTDQGAARSAGCPFVAVGHGTAASQDCDAVIDHVGQITLS